MELLFQRKVFVNISHKDTKRRKATAGGAGCSWGAEGPWTLHAVPLPHRLLLLLAGHAAFTSRVPASEGLPRHQAGVGDGRAGCQGTRDPAAGQCTVDEGRPHWMVRPCTFRTPSLDPRWRCCCPQCPPGAQEVEEKLGCPSHLLPREWQRPVPKVGAGWAEWVLGLTGSLWRGVRCCLDPSWLVPLLCCLHIRSQGRGSPGAHSITRPGADNPPYLLWSGRQGGWCDTPLGQRRDPLGCVSSTPETQVGSSGGMGKRGTNSFLNIYYLNISDNHWVPFGFWFQIFLIWSIFRVFI